MAITRDKSVTTGLSACEANHGISASLAFLTTNKGLPTEYAPVCRVIIGLKHYF